ncbi:hypothetical protein V1498_20320 [Peribacillus sp. SCS-26]|uniref:hypothetical protein n=1 Tax=Paraperibacillus marinus TaxID=3115295 RepID=UPI003906C534
MKAYILVFLHIVLTVIWMLDGGFLFSVLGICLWFFAIAAGLFMCSCANKTKTENKVLFCSSMLMMGLGLLTIVMNLVHSSMY